MKNKTIKIISALLIFSTIMPAVLFSGSRQASAAGVATNPGAVPAEDKVLNSMVYTQLTPTQKAQLVTEKVTTGTVVKDWLQTLKELLLKEMGKKALQAMTQSIINWINSDFHGSPLFLENPSLFFKDIMKSEIQTLVGIIGFDPRYPFGQQVAMGIINQYKSTFAMNAASTYGTAMRPDTPFSSTGWNGFFLKTQYPQNTYLGFQQLTAAELAKQIQGTIQAPAQQVQSLLQQGMGFLSPQKCPSNPSYNNGYNEFNKPVFDPSVVPYDCGSTCPDIVGPSQDPNCAACRATYSANLTTARSNWAGENTCPGGLVNTTPGSVVASQITNALNVPVNSTMMEMGLGNDLAAIFDALINHFMQKGLTELADTINPQENPNDNWSYNGVCLEDSCGGTGPGKLKIPTDVSIALGTTDPACPAGSPSNSTCTPITGGKPPYSIKVTDPVTPNASIATASISDNGTDGYTLMITGVAPGTTSVTIKDSSPTTKNVKVNITVVGNGSLMVIPANITANIGEETNATISGGTGKYTVSADPDQTVAIATVGNNTLIVTGVRVGTTSVTISDSGTPSPQTTTVNISIVNSGTDELVIIPGDITAGTGPAGGVASIAGGAAPYSITTEPDPTIATADISQTDGTSIDITGIKEGTTSMTVSDSSSPAPKSVTVQIKISETPSSDLATTPDSVSVSAGAYKDFVISGGKPPYSVDNGGGPTHSIATIEKISSSTFRVTGVGPGTTEVTIRDGHQSPNVRRITVSIDVSSNP